MQFISGKFSFGGRKKIEKVKKKGQRKDQSEVKKRQREVRCTNIEMPPSWFCKVSKFVSSLVDLFGKGSMAV